MKIAGLQKLTLLDYPGKVACTVFLDGCNFRCPFCHNSQLLEGQSEAAVTEEELIAFLRRRQGILDGVCITGGEPTIHPQLVDLLHSIKNSGYQIKLDTNGYHPKALRGILEEGLVDYVAMDVKNSPRLYGETVGLPKPDLTKIEESLLLLMDGTVEYELRTTVVDPLHSKESISDMARWLLEVGNGRKVRKWFIQPFADRESVAVSGLRTPEYTDLELFLAQLKPCAEQVALRGI